MLLPNTHKGPLNHLCIHMFIFFQVMSMIWVLFLNIYNKPCIFAAHKQGMTSPHHRQIWKTNCHFCYCLKWLAFVTCNYTYHIPYHWHHNERNDVSNHQPHDCLLNHLFRHRSKKTSNSASLAFMRRIHQWQVNSPHKGTVTWKMFPFDDMIIPSLVKSPGGDFMFLYRCRRPQIPVHTITFEQFFDFFNFWHDCWPWPID